MYDHVQTPVGSEYADRLPLQVKHNDTTAAVNAILDGEDINGLEKSETWDEGAWASDRNGNMQMAPLGTSAAPTRGPSPAPSLGLKNPKTQADEEEDLQRALMMSQNGGGDIDAMSFQQETGVRNADGSESRKYFGPATKTHYEEQQWALTHVAQEVIPDVPARERKHTQFEPRTLKYLADGDYTPNLLSICHAIPKAKEALLIRQQPKADYGYDADWWRGHAIAMPRIVHTTVGGHADIINDGQTTELSSGSVAISEETMERMLEPLAQYFDEHRRHVSVNPDLKPMDWTPYFRSLYNQVTELVRRTPRQQWSKLPERLPDPSFIPAVRKWNEVSTLR